MAVILKEKSFWTLVLIVIVGILIGSYCNSLVRALIPGENNVVKTFFTTNICFGIGDFGDRKALIFDIEGQDKREARRDLDPLVIDLNAIKFQLGFQIKLSFMSVIGILISLYFFRWYR